MGRMGQLRWKSLPSLKSKGERVKWSRSPQENKNKDVAHLKTMPLGGR